MPDSTPPAPAQADQAAPAPDAKQAATTTGQPINYAAEEAKRERAQLLEHIGKLDAAVRELYARPAPAPAQDRAPPPPRDIATYELFPAWLQREIDAGSDPDLIKQLRAALTKAVRETQGILHKSNENPEQGYSYLGHENVMAACRDAMAANGLSVDQPLIELERPVQIAVGDKMKPRWMWRVICLITHDSGGVLPRVVRPLTHCNDKASFVARTAADRTVLLSAMRIAGARDEQPEHRSNNDPDETAELQREARERQQRQGQARSAQPVNRQPRRDRVAPTITPEQNAEADRQLAELLEVLQPRKTSEQLVEWARIHMFDYALPQAQKQKAWAAYEQKCKEGKYDPKALADQARKEGPIDDAQDPSTGEMRDIDRNPPQ